MAHFGRTDASGRRQLSEVKLTSLIRLAIRHLSHPRASSCNCLFHERVFARSIGFYAIFRGVSDPTFDAGVYARAIARLERELDGGARIPARR
jgi:hypothetical protein